MTFWAISLGLAALAALTLAGALWRRRGDGGARRFDVQVYRDQLREVERDLARGVVGESEAEAIRTEVSRRLLEADRADLAAARAEGAPMGLTLAAALLVALAVIGGAGALYWRLGAPGYPDLPLERRIALAEEMRQNRIAQAEAEALAGPAPPPATAADPDYLALVDKLRATVAERPDDLQGHQLLARQEAALQNFPAARAAQARVIALRGPEATAQDYATLAELYVTAANGYVSPEAETALREALARDPQNQPARYYSGLLAAQIGRYDVAFRLWRRLLEEGPDDAPWVPPIRADIGALAELAGVRYEPPAAPRGPSAADIEAAGEMTPEERLEMIRGMVAGLSERLAGEGGSPEEWARLIRAYGVLGETGRAAAIWAEAQQVFPEEAALAPVRAAARDAGVAE